MEIPIDPVTVNEVKSVIRQGLNARTSSGYDLITGKVLKELSGKAYIF